MPRNRRPPLILVMAILNFVMGGLTLLCGLCAAGGNALVAAMGTNNQMGIGDMTTYMDKEVPGWQVIEVGRGLLLILLAVILIVAGIGLLKMQTWARWVCVFYAVASILLTIGHATFELAVAKPAMDKWKQKQTNQPPPSGAYKAGEVFGAGMVAAIPIIYALTLGITMFLPNVGEAFDRANRRPRVPRRDEDYYEYDGDEGSDEYDDDRRYRRRREY
jgi:hypothetical protein